MTEKDWLYQCLFLESMAGVPGMVGGMMRHLRLLRLLKCDYGWIYTPLEEAENERMHLYIFMKIKQLDYCFRALVMCHRFVGSLEEEAVKTYTCLLQDIEDGQLDAWKERKVLLIAQAYYKQPEDASVYDVIK
ncbi:Alternative oxidase [Phytophthora cinnamomi]|uniref:Alternative oxidase n=1 Tax=Phytophthora cinnamomi TaxID=4785 RepID=UPI003559EE9C|nr:Alternative oxidase [Phytophthora cinnamomi]